MWYFEVKFKDLLIKDPATAVQYGLDGCWIFWGYYSKRSLMEVCERFQRALSAHHAYVTIYKGQPPHITYPDAERYHKDDPHIQDLCRLLQCIV